MFNIDFLKKKLFWNLVFKYEKEIFYLFDLNLLKLIRRLALPKKLKKKAPQIEFLIYHHIGFTGSSSFSAALNTIIENTVYHPRDLDLSTEQTFFDSLEAKHKGEFLINMHCLVPQLPSKFIENYQKIQILRRPEKIHLSNYYWNRKMVEENIEKNGLNVLEEDNEKFVGPHQKNFYLNDFNWYLNNFALHFPNTVSRNIFTTSLNLSDFKSFTHLQEYVRLISDDELFEKVRKILSSYLFVGITEFMSDSLFILMLLINGEKVPPWFPMGVSSAPKLDDLTTEQFLTLQNISKVDIAIYEEFLTRFTKDYGKIIEIYTCYNKYKEKSTKNALK